MNVPDKLRRGRISIFAAAFCSILLIIPPAAVANRHDQIILTMKHDDQVREFSANSLAAFETKVVKAVTNWTDGVNEFEGPLVRDLLEAVGVDSSLSDLNVKTKALDDYSVDIPMADFFKYDAILATKMNGKTLTRRDKGPVWIIFPSIEHPKFNEEGNHYKWVWQLFEIEILNDQ